jgi:hypothetical protein
VLFKSAPKELFVCSTEKLHLPESWSGPKKFSEGSVPAIEIALRHFQTESEA